MDLHPDIAMRATIIDVTNPFESAPEALDEARAEKLSKHAPLATWLEEEKGLATTVYAFVVSSLGSWDLQNSATLRDLHIGHRYAKLFKKLSAVDAVKGSHSIWVARSSFPG